MDVAAVDYVFLAPQKEDDDGVFHRNWRTVNCWLQRGFPSSAFRTHYMEAEMTEPRDSTSSGILNGECA